MTENKIVQCLDKTTKVLKKINNFNDQVAKYFIDYGLRCALAGTILFGSYLLIGSTAVVIRNKSLLNKGTQYQTTEEATKDLESEKQQLGLENVVINIELDDKHASAVTHKIDEDHYDIVLGKARNVYALRHEMFHIHEMKTLKITIWNCPVMPWGNITAEWRATSYALERDEK